MGRRYIDSDKLKDYLIKGIDEQPTADVRENVKGEWIKSEELAIDWYYCSNCKEEAYCDTDYGQQLFNYCPNCGADMRNDVITKQPAADVVEVVRCEDCKYYEAYNNDDHGTCKQGVRYDVYPDDYCSYGERE